MRRISMQGENFFFNATLTKAFNCEESKKLILEIGFLLLELDKKKSVPSTLSSCVVVFSDCDIFKSEPPLIEIKDKTFEVVLTLSEVMLTCDSLVEKIRLLSKK